MSYKLGGAGPERLTCGNLNLRKILQVDEHEDSAAFGHRSAIQLTPQCRSLPRANPESGLQRFSLVLAPVGWPDGKPRERAEPACPLQPPPVGPGVDPAAIDISVDDDVLTVRAERKPGDDAAPETVQREVDLSDKLDTDRLDAGYDNGVLTLRIPISARTAAS